MAEINNSWSIGSVAPVSGVHDYATSYINVGNELNKQYWQNRQAHLENVSALSKVEASEYGQKLLNTVKSEYNDKASEFEESGMWHRAGNFVYDMAQQITTDPRLPAIMKDKAQYDAFMKSVSESEWSTADKQAFILRAHHASKDLEVKNGIASGGFTPISVGKPFDVNDYTMKLFNVIKDIKADSKAWTEIISDPAKLQAYGLPSIVSNDGKTIMSHIIFQDFKKTEVTATDVYNAAMQLLMKNTDVENQISQEQINKFYNKYYDKANRKFLKVPESEWGNIFGHQYYGVNGKTLAKQYIEDLLNKDGKLNRLISTNSKGKKIINTNLKDDDDYIDLDNIAHELFGIDLKDIFDDNKITPDVINKVAITFGKNKLNPYGGTIDDNVLAQKVLSQMITNAWEDTITGITGSAISLYAYADLEVNTKPTVNPQFEIEAKAKAKRDEEAAKLAGVNPIDPTMQSSIDVDKPIEYPDYVQTNLEEINKLSTQLNSLIVSNQNIYKKLADVDGDMLVKLGLATKTKSSEYVTPIININNKALLETDLNALDKKATDEGYYDDPHYQDVRQSIINLKSNQLNMDNVRELQNAYKYNAKQLYAEYNKDPNKYRGIGWFGLFSDTALFIANHNITTVEEFREAAKKLKPEEHRVYGDDSNITGSKIKYFDEKGYVYITQGLGSLKINLSDAEIQKEISNVLDNIANKYRKNTGQDFKFVRNSYTITNHSIDLEKDLANRRAVWSGSSSALQVVSLANGKPGGEILPQQIASLINLNQFPVTITTSAKGVTIKEQNIANSNSTPIDGSDFGIKDKIYSTEIKYSLNPLDQKDGYMSYNIICKGKSGEYLGTIQCREKDSHINTFMLNVFDQFNALSEKGNNRAQEAIGILISNVNETAYTFDSTTAQPAKNLTELENNIDNMVRSGKNGFIYTLNSQNVLGGNLMQPIQIKITRVVDGYVIEDLSETNTSAKGKLIIPGNFRTAFEQNHIKVDDADTHWDGKTVFPTLGQAFKDISEFNLKLSSALRRLSPQISQ